MEEMKIYRKRGMAVFSIIFFLVAACALGYCITLLSPMISSEDDLLVSAILTFTEVWGCLLIVFMLLYAIFLCMKVFSDKPYIVVGKDSVTEFPSFGDEQVFAYQDIESVRHRFVKYRYRGRSGAYGVWMIHIVEKENAEARRVREASWLTRWRLRYQKFMYGEHFFLESENMTMKGADIAKTINERIAAHNERHRPTIE